MAALTVISYMQERNKKNGATGGNDALLKLSQTEEDRHRETKHQLQRKIQHSQLLKMKTQQEHRKKLQNRLSQDGTSGTELIGDRTNRLSVERSQSVPADRFISDLNLNSGSGGGKNSVGELNSTVATTDRESSKDNCQKTEFVDGASVSTTTSQGAILSTSTSSSQPQQNTIPGGVKDSPVKRRYTPIQPKTPVRDGSNTIKAVPINIPGLPKGQQSQQFFLLQNPNGTAHLATEVIQNGQKVLKLVEGGAAQLVPTNVPAGACGGVTSTNVTCGGGAKVKPTTPVTSGAAVAPKQIVLVSRSTPLTNMKQDVTAAQQKITPHQKTVKTETIAANAALLVSPSTHVLVSPVKAPVAATSQTVSKLISASPSTVVNPQMISNAGHQVVIKTAPVVNTSLQGQIGNNTSILSPAFQLDNRSQGSTATQNVGAGGTLIKKEVVSRGPTPTVDMNLGSPTPPVTTSMTYVRAVVHAGSPNSSSPCHHTTHVLSACPGTVTTDSIATPVVCLPSTSSSSSTIPHTGSASALLKVLSSTVNSNYLAAHQQTSDNVVNTAGKQGSNHQQLTQHQQQQQVYSRTSAVQQKQQPPHYTATSTHPKSKSSANKRSSEIIDKTEHQLQQVAHTLQLRKQQEQLQRQLQAADGNFDLTISGTPSGSTPVSGNQPVSSAATTRPMTMLQTALMSPISYTSTVPTTKTTTTQGITSEAVARFNALQLHDQNITSAGGGGTIMLQGNQLGLAMQSGQMVSVQMQPAVQQQHPGFIPVSGVKRFAVDTATVLSNGMAISVDSIQQQQLQQQQQQQNVAAFLAANQTITNAQSLPAFIMKPVDMGVIPISQIQTIVTSTSQQIHSGAPSRSASVASMQSPLTLTINNGHVTPIMHSASGASTPIPMSIGSVPPSPVDGSSFFTPIQQMDQSRLISNASPVKRTQKVKPRANYPKTTSSGAEFANQQGIQQQQQQQHPEIASKPNFVTPTRKRRTSGQKRANPYPPQRQTTPVVSPAGSRCSTPVSPATQNPNIADSISMPPPSPGLPVFDNVIMGTGRQNRSSSPAMWSAARRTRNPSGPATYTPIHQSANRQHSLESNSAANNAINQTDLNNLNNPVYYDQNGRPQRLPPVSQRSQSVPLPDLPEAQLLHLQFQQVISGSDLQTQLASAVQQQAATNNVTPVEAVSQDKVLASISGTEFRGIQANSGNNYNAKRNLTLELQEISVTEEDFGVTLAGATAAPQNLNTAQNYLSPDGGVHAQPGTNDLDALNVLLNSNSQPSEQNTDVVAQRSSWSSSRGGDPTLGSAPSVRTISDLNVGFEIGGSADQPGGSGGTASGLPDDQSLLFSQTVNGEASNSTSSTLNEDIAGMEDPLSDFATGSSFDLSAWNSSSLSTLECGM